MPLSPGVVSRPIGFRPSEISSLINEPVIATHASEAAFLWTLRRKATQAPHYRLKHLRKIDSRVLAHLAGLRIAGDDGWRAAQTALADVDGSVLFVAAFLAFDRRDARLMNHVLQVALTGADLEAALCSALEWLDPTLLKPLLDRLCVSAHAEHQRIGLTTLLAHRLPADGEIARAVRSDDPELRRVALTGIGDMQRDDLVPFCKQAVRDRDEKCRFAATYSLALNGDSSGAMAVLDAGLQIPTLRRVAIEVAFRSGDRGWARDTVRAWAGSPDRVRDTIHAIGAHGDPATIPWLLDRMDGEHGLAAGEAFAMMTGIDLKYADLTLDAENEEPPEPDDADLPTPNAVRVREWWQDHRAEFQSGTRYLAGKPVSEASHVLREGYQRQRSAAAIEVACSARTPMFPVAARADWQQRWLAR